MINETETTEVKQDNKKTKPASFELMLIKALACTLIIIGVLVIKKNNTELYQNVCGWYKENMSEQNLDLVEIKDRIYNFGNNAVHKIINSISTA